MDYTRIESHIDAVTVYREGALVRRVAEIVRRDGAYPRSVCLTGLPLSLSDASVRVRVVANEDAGADGARGLPVASDVRVTLDVPDGGQPAPPPVDANLETARSALRDLAGQMAQVKRELARVERLTLVGRPHDKRQVTEPPPLSPTEARLALLAVREEQERALRRELRELEREMVRAERYAQELEAQHQRATSARQAHEHELRKALVIALAEEEAREDEDGASEDDRAVGARLVLEYLVPGARWAPAYTIRLAGEDDASFAMRAVVVQKTGEDWRDVMLTLSTADAHHWTELPELASIRIGRRQRPSDHTGWRPPPSGVDQLFSDYDRELGTGGGARGTGGRSQWEDQTREITSPTTRRPVLSASYLADDGAAVSYDEEEDARVSYLEEPEEATVPHLRPPPGPPPASDMAPAAMPAPQGAPMAPSRRQRAKTKKKAQDKGRGRAAPMRSSVASSGAAPAPPMLGGMGPGGGGYGGAVLAEEQMEPESESLSLRASSELLAYNDLRMPAPRSGDRGTLQKADPREVYTELLLSQRIEVSFNVMTVVSVAMERARSVAARPLPPGLRVAGSDRYDYAYSAETPVDVPSDGAYHSIALLSKSADTSMNYVVVPRESTDVFRTAELTNPLRAPILDGPVDVYLGKDFLLTSDVHFTPPGGTVRLGLGVEQAIKVTRNTSYREETSGLLRGSLLLCHTIEIELQNHLERTITCEVRERIPSTRKGEDDIEVSVAEVEPRWRDYAPELASSPEVGLEGGRVWRVEVPGKGGKKSLRATYNIKIPSKYELVGGNRREA